MRLLVTRPQPQAAQWVDALRRQGIDAEAFPLIRIEPVDDAGAVHAAWAALPTFALVLFVSPNAVERFFALRPDGATWPAGLRGATPGPGSAQALRGAGVAQVVQPAHEAVQFDSEALWQQLEREPWHGQRVLVVRGDGGREWLADRLRERGAEVQFVQAYRRVPPLLDAHAGQLLDTARSAPALSAWHFSSSQALDHLAQLAPGTDWSHARAIVSHPRIAARAHELGFGTVQTVAPTIDAVVAALRAPPTMRPTVNDATPATAVTAASPPTPVPSPRGAPAWWIVVAVLALVALGGLALAWSTQQRLRGLEKELVRRQAESQTHATEARTLARQAQDAAREASAKMALLEARVAENTLQRTQFEDLIQSLSRSRDENIVADVEAAVRVALQQSAITGSAEPLVAVLKQADERLARYNQPRLERVRRAVARDLDKVKAIGVADISTLSIRIDEAVRQVDELPLLSAAEPRKPAPARAAAARAASAPGSTGLGGEWGERLNVWWQAFGVQVWDEVRSLVRVTRIDNPEAVLVAPEQAFFLRENLKLRLLNARLALLSRQFDTAQSDLRDAQAALDRYFDRSHKRVLSTSELVRQVATQARLIQVPRPDDTLAALAAAGAGR